MRPISKLILFFAAISIIIILVYVYYKQDGKYVEIPHPTQKPVVSSFLPDKDYRNFIKANKVSSVTVAGVVFNFNQDGFLSSLEYSRTHTSKYIYKNKKLIKIIKPVSMYNEPDLDSIIFTYDGSKVKQALTYAFGKKGEPISFSYYTDSIVVLNASSDQKSLDKLIFELEGEIVIKETRYRFGELSHIINYKYSSDKLLEKVYEYPLIYGKQERIIMSPDGIPAMTILGNDTIDIYIKRDSVIEIANYGGFGKSALLPLTKFK